MGSNKHGVNVIAYFKGAFGLSESARQVVGALKSQNIPFSLISTDNMASHHNSHDFFGERISEEFIYPINLFCIDPEGIAFFIENNDWSKFENRHNISFWFWETNLIPTARRKGWEYLDEFWVSSRYSQEHLSIATTIPVYRIPQPVQATFTPRATKSDFSLPNRFTFLFCFDFFSVEGRKNPEAIIKAFQKAFPHRSDIQLVIKSQNGEKFPKRLDVLKNYAANDSRIFLINHHIESSKRYSLMNICDCYISLHRSEGLGLTMAETMLLGKPVIATGYSGNLDFMHDDNSFLCSYTLKEIGNGHPPYPKNGIWAEIDIDHAAKLMKYVLENPEEAKIKAKNGQEFIQKKHSLEYVGIHIAERLKAIQNPTQAKTRPLKHILKNTVHKSIGRYLQKIKSIVKRIVKKLIQE